GEFKVVNELFAGGRAVAFVEVADDVFVAAGEDVKGEIADGFGFSGGGGGAGGGGGGGSRRVWVLGTGGKREQQCRPKGQSIHEGHRNKRCAGRSTFVRPTWRKSSACCSGSVRTSGTSFRL